MLVGVVGKANVGKSTFFKALTLADIQIANYPFVTIKPNNGVGFVKIECVCKDFDKQCSPKSGHCTLNNRFIPVDIIDVAGLVPGAYEGKGMGNQFLDDLRQADVLIHVIDVSGSTNDKGEPVSAGSHDPAKDIKFLEVELDMWYFQIFQKVWDKFSRQVQQEHGDIIKSIAKQFSGLKIDEELVKNSIKKLSLDPKKAINWTEEQLKQLVTEFRKATKPMIIACNKIDVAGAKENYEKLKKEFVDYLLVPCSSESELALKEAAKHELIKYIPGTNSFEVIGELNDKQKNALEFIKNNILKVYNTTGVQDVLDKAVFELLNYIVVFPVPAPNLQDADGKILPDAFLIPSNTTALEFAYKVHTDFGKNFIKAIDVKTKLPIGKDHPVKHKDVIEIMKSN
ncbi:redox-regulated ATPase YchF [Candidatus Woesearchaeota archaeon]|nr:redox-regulated ATPase YchF [Candidatus Woesearchaeota archaeon]